jgi:hypothetical protein
MAASFPNALNRCRNEPRDDEKYWYELGNESPGPMSEKQPQYSHRDGCGSPSALVLDNVWYHDINGLGENGAETHTGPLQNGGHSACPMQINGLTIRRSRWERVVIGSIAPVNSDDNVLIENTMFGPNASSATNANCTPMVDCGSRGSSGRSFEVGGGWGDGLGQNWTVRFNTFYDGARVSGSFSNARLYGNIFLSTNHPGSCGSFVYSYNLWARNSTPCTGSNLLTMSGLPLVDANYHASASYDFHLAGSPGSTPADNFVPAGSDCPAIDYDGDARPIAGYCDAGADER